MRKVTKTHDTALYTVVYCSLQLLNHKNRKTLLSAIAVFHCTGTCWFNYMYRATNVNILFSSVLRCMNQKTRLCGLPVTSTLYGQAKAGYMTKISIVPVIGL